MTRGGKFEQLTVVFVIVALAILANPLCVMSSTYNVGEDFFDYGGGYGTSTNYILTDDIGNPVEYISHYVAPPPEPPNNPDTTAPVISAIQVINITTTSAVITWTTDEPSTSYVNYGLTATYGGTTGSSLMVLLHSVSLAGLNPSTTYHFRVRSTDTSTNEAVSGDYSFKTLTPPDATAPIISNVVVSNITDTSAKVSWQTNEAADSLIDYGLTPAYGASASSTDRVTVHSFDLTGLTIGTLYHFKIFSKDATGNSASTGDLSFTTNDSVAPTISNLNIIDITSTSAKVSWQTDEPADSKVDYGRTLAYEIGSIFNAAFGVGHLIPLAGLLPNTGYHIRVHSKDAFGNETISLDKTFQTLKDAAAPTNVSNFVVAPSDSLNLLNWVNPTDFDFSGVLIKKLQTGFPVNPSDGATVYNGAGTAHTDSGLINGTIYYYTAFAYDTSGNFASGAMALGTPTAAIPPPPPPPPPPPGEEVPPGIPPGVPPPGTILPESIPLENFNFYLSHRTIKVFPDKLSQITTLLGNDITIDVAKDKFIIEPKYITLNVGDSNYFFASSTLKYEVGFQVPKTAGEYNAIITIFYDAGRASQTSFKIIVKPLGMVSQKVKDKQTPVDGAKISLYLQTPGGWQLWDSGRYFQENPKTTTANGLYGFVVPNGTYYLKVEKKDFRARETDRFEIFDNVINQNIEILAIPPLLEINPEAPLAENIANITKNLGAKAGFAAKIAAENIIDFIQNPSVEQATEQIALPTIATVSVVNTVVAVNFFNFWSYLQYLLTQPFLLFKRKKRFGWGVIYNSLSKMPIDLAIARLFDQNNGRLIQTRVTDKEGRYIFMSSPGLYRIEVKKRGFIFPSAYLKRFKEDFIFTDLYHGEAIEVKEKGAVITANIPLDPIEEKPSRGRLAWQRIFKGIQFGLAISGIILSGISMLIAPKLLSYIIFGGQIALFLLFWKLARPPKPKGWGIVYDKETKKPLGSSVVRIFETQFNKLLSSQITDSKGRYSFLTGRNIYYVTAEKGGYESVKTNEIDLRQEKKVEMVAPDIALLKIKQKENEEKIQFGGSKIELEK